jgi:hypothetical protein
MKQIQPQLRQISIWFPAAQEMPVEVLFLTPSPGTPGEGRGEGRTQVAHGSPSPRLSPEYGREGKGYGGLAS